MGCIAIYGQYNIWRIYSGGGNSYPPILTKVSLIMLIYNKTVHMCECHVKYRITLFGVKLVVMQSTGSSQQH